MFSVELLVTLDLTLTTEFSTVRKDGLFFNCFRVGPSISNLNFEDYPCYKACHVAKCDDYSHLSWILLRRVPTVISDGNSHLTGRWIFFASFWLGPTLFRSYTLAGITRVTTEDLDEMRSVFFIPPAELSRTMKLLSVLFTHNDGEQISDRSGNGIFFASFWIGPRLFRS